jgi:hypothetical protein
MNVLHYCFEILFPVSDTHFVGLMLAVLMVASVQAKIAVARLLTTGEKI